jgi:cellulose synthase/poly-beta-1,6-N-acetylglucosamine synthase-like glycosyltransferase
MELILAILFWASAIGVLYTYLFYPLLLHLLARGKQPNAVVFEQADEWPRVSILLSVYNEEKVITEKLDSLCQLDYPAGRLRIFIGSDCSSDQTNDIVASYARQYPYLHFFPFQERNGKPGVINRLYDEAMAWAGHEQDHVLVITDASVMMSAQSVREMVKHFRHPGIGLVDSRIVHTGMQKEGISRSEDTYISREFHLKHLEGLIWGKMIGPFGGCYAIRASYFSKVPPNFLVDDFYITMKMFEQGAMAINESSALCYEGVSHELSEEYRRKSRISAGNFQNLFTFPHLWWPPFAPLQFAFFSHKVLRWIVPFLLIIMLIALVALSLMGNLFYALLLVLLVLGLFFVPLLDVLLKKAGINFSLLRNIRYFLMMNLALLEGFFKYIKGIRSNVWEPTKRN